MMSRVNEQVEVDRGRMVWELIGSRVWSSSRSVVVRRAQMRVGRRLLGASNTVAGVAVQRDLGWRRGRK